MGLPAPTFPTTLRSPPSIGPVPGRNDGLHDLTLASRQFILCRLVGEPHVALEDHLSMAAIGRVVRRFCP